MRIFLFKLLPVLYSLIVLFCYFPAFPLSPHLRFVTVSLCHCSGASPSLPALCRSPCSAPWAAPCRFPVQWMGPRCVSVGWCVQFRDKVSFEGPVRPLAGGQSRRLWLGDLCFGLGSELELKVWESFLLRWWMRAQLLLKGSRWNSRNTHV